MRDHRGKDRQRSSEPVCAPEAMRKPRATMSREIAAMCGGTFKGCSSFRNITELYRELGDGGPSGRAIRTTGSISPSGSRTSSRSSCVKPRAR